MCARPAAAPTSAIATQVFIYVAPCWLGNAAHVPVTSMTTKKVAKSTITGPAARDVYCGRTLVERLPGMSIGRQSLLLDWVVKGLKARSYLSTSARPSAQLLVPGDKTCD